MTREQFEKLKVGDYVILYGMKTVVTRKGKITYDANCKLFEGDVSFAWNEGEPL